MRVLQVPFLPHAIVYFLLEALVCFARVAGEDTGTWGQCWNCPTQLELSQPSNSGAQMCVTGSCGWRGFASRADGGCGEVTGPFLVNLERSWAVLEPTRPLRAREQRQLSSNCPWQDTASKVLSQSYSSKKSGEFYESQLTPVLC